MALVLKDRVKETTSTTGTSNFVLGGASSGYQAFSVIGANNFTYYCCFDNATGDWEVGYGQYTTTAGGTLVRTTVLSNSAATTNKISFAAGPKDVFVTYPAEKAIYEESDGNVIIDAGPITVVGNGVTGYTTFSAALGEMYANVNSFAQFYAQNLNSGSSASTDIVAYNNLGDGTNNFIDMGISSSNYTEVAYPIFTPASGYLYNDGGELIIGTATAAKDVLLFSGGVAASNWAARISGTNQSITTKAGLTLGGALTGVGGTFTAPVTSTSSMVTPGTTEFVTRAYVDDATSNGFHVHTPVLVATTGNLTATYNQPGGAGVGVGATLTNSGTQVALSIDGVAMAVGNRILVWQQTSGLQNGVYVVTTVGSGSTNWVLTRSSDANTSSEGDPGTLGGGDYFFVESGTTQGYFSFICNNTSAIVFGTTAITFAEFSSVPTYTGTAPINVSGSVIALTGTVAATNGGTGVSTVTTGDLLYGSGTNTWAKLPAGAGYRSLVMNAGGTQVEWNAVALNQTNAVSGALGATNGGTGQNAYAVGDILYSGTTNALAKLAGNTTTTKKFLGQTGTGSASQAPSWQQPAATDITGLAASATTDTTNASNISSGTLGTARLSGSYTGITGVGTLAAGTWNGSAIGAVYGGTGQTSYAVGDLVYANTTTTLAKLADVAVGNALISGGVGSAPSYGKIGLATHVSGTLPVANGGTGSSSTQFVALGTNVSGTLPIANGGSGTTTAQGAMNAFAGAVTSGSYLRGNGTNVVMNTIQAADVPTLNQSTTGNAATATTLQTARTINLTSFNGSANIEIPRVKSIDDRAAAPADGSAGYATFGFGSWNNNNTTPYADNWILRSYTDDSGGLDNMLSFRKDALGMRVWQQTFGSATNFSSFKDVAWTDGTNSSGTWGISITGNAATATSSPLLSALSNYVWSQSTLPNSYNLGIQSAFVGPSAGEGAWQNYGSVMTIRTYSGGGGSLQMYVPYSPNNGGTGMQVRFGNYDVSSGNSWTSWKILLASDNYNSYAPTLTGGGASGTWGINVTGNAATATVLQTARTINGVSFNGSANITVTAAANGGNSSTVGGFTPSASSGVGSRVVVADPNGYIFNNYFNSTDNSVSSGVSAVMVKQGDNYFRSGTAQSIASFISGTSMNIAGSASTATTLTSTQSNWNSTGVASNVVGLLGWKNYSNSHVIFDASASTTPSGTSCNNTNPQQNWTGTYPTLMGWNGSTTYGVRVDSARTSDQLGGYAASSWVGQRGNSYYQVETWLQLSGFHGLYAPGANSAHFYPNNISSYTTWAMAGSRGGYGGITDSHSSVSGFMYDGGGNGGVYREAQGRWYFYHNLSDNCMGVGTSATSSSYGIYVIKGVYSEGNVVAFSDERVKTNWQDYPADFVEQLAKVKHGTYDRTDLELTQDGVSAQSLRNLLPYSAPEDEHGKLSVNYGGAALVSAVELAKRVVEQDKRIAALEALVAKFN